MLYSTFVNRTAVPVLIECWKDCPPLPSDPLSALKDYMQAVGKKVPVEIGKNIPEGYFKDLGELEGAMAEGSLKTFAKIVGKIVSFADTAEAIKKTFDALMTDCKKTTTTPTKTTTTPTKTTTTPTKTRTTNYVGCCCTLGSPSECHCDLPDGKKVSTGVKWKWELFCYNECASYCAPAIDCHRHC